MWQVVKKKIIQRKRKNEQMKKKHNFCCCLLHRIDGVLTITIFYSPYSYSFYYFFTKMKSKMLLVDTHKHTTFFLSQQRR